MKAHWLNNGETVLVTGTSDVTAALAHLEEYEPDMHSFAEDHKGHPERGNIIPQHPEADYRWVWYAKNDGRVKSVHFE